VACGNGTERETMDQEPGQPPAAASPAGQDDRNAQVTVTGCLQQGDGSDFILTEATDLPDQPIATSGDQPGGTVQQEQRQAAANSYRLSGGPDNLREMVGHRVRITGTIAERGNVQERQGERPREGEPREADIDQGDLAEIEVASAQSVGETCGSTRPRQ
jgi:hypothetical protein